MSLSVSISRTPSIPVSSATLGVSSARVPRQSASVSSIPTSVRTSVPIRESTSFTRPIASTSTSTLSSASIASITPIATLPLPPGGSGGNGSGGSSGGSGGGTGDGVNGRGGDIADQNANSPMPSKSVVGGVSAVLIVAFIAGTALVYYRRVKRKEQERHISAGPVDPQGYDIDYDTIEAGKTGRYL
ncbi:MAG: hypothetical protein J3Q66DRAFT_428855 [Benniella sp.]|nr:MAG: hypothetical protein J3Q66DRAFT_428855 [Benniella sp.]